MILLLAPDMGGIVFVEQFMRDNGFTSYEESGSTLDCLRYLLKREETSQRKPSDVSHHDARAMAKKTTKNVHTKPRRVSKGKSRHRSCDIGGRNASQ